MPSIKEQLARVEEALLNSPEMVNSVKPPRAATKGSQGMAIVFTCTRNIAVHVDTAKPFRAEFAKSAQALENEAIALLRRPLAIRNAAEQL